MKKRKKSVPELSPEEEKLVEQLRERRTKIDKIRKEMDAIETKIAPLAARRVLSLKLKKAGVSEEELKAAGAK